MLQWVRLRLGARPCLFERKRLTYLIGDALMDQPIIGYVKDDDGHWVADLACGHRQHLRHNPPWVERPWVLTSAGRGAMLGHCLPCKKCDIGAPPDL